MWFIPILINLLASCCLGSSKQTRVSFSAPVNPVEAGGVVGLHCQVWNLKDGIEEVSILKGTKRLSLDELVTTDGENTFVAKRQLGDGSLVFFLSMIGVTRETAGAYRCRVVNTESAQVVAHEDITLKVMYFPGDTDPICSSDVKSLIVDEGSAIKLNCSSEIAVPSVEISWKKSATSDKILLDSKEETNNGRKSSILTIKPKTGETGSIYLCEVTSRAFPKKLRTCHIGPITVRSKSNTNPRFTEISTDSSKNGLNPPDSTTATAVSIMNADYVCNDICSSYSSQKIYWILATAGATILALIFFVLVMTLCIKFHHLDEGSQSGYSYPRYPMEKIYSEVESRRVDDRVYMSLVKLKKQNENACLQEITGDGRYHSPNLEMK